MEIAIPLYDRFTALDAIGPYQVLSMLPGATVLFLAAEPGPVRTDNGMLTVLAERRYEDAPEPDVLVVPGGPGTRAMLADERVLGWLRSAHESSRYTTSVCTGSLLLAAAGLLDDRRATTHWASVDWMRGQYPAVTMLADARVVDEGRIVTSAGVSAGIDMALHVVARLHGEETAAWTARRMEYDWRGPAVVGRGDGAGG